MKRKFMRQVSFPHDIAYFGFEFHELTFLLHFLVTFSRTSNPSSASLAQVKALKAGTSASPRTVA